MGILRVYKHNYDLLTNVTDRLNRDHAINVIVADYALREQLQHEETLNHRAIASQKSTATDYDKTQRSETIERLEQTKRQRAEKERALYRAVSMLPLAERDAYDAVRRDPAWFMGEYLVEDCSNQGGCCSRQCGCCAKRHLSKAQKGIGHCTSECWCCISFRGFDLTENDKREIRDDMGKSTSAEGGQIHVFAQPGRFFFSVSSENGYLVFLPSKMQEKESSDSKWEIRKKGTFWKEVKVMSA